MDMQLNILVPVVPYAIKLARALEPYNLKWMEELLPPDDYEGYEEVKKALGGTQAGSDSVTMCFGTRFMSHSAPVTDSIECLLQSSLSLFALHCTATRAWRSICARNYVTSHAAIANNIYLLGLPPEHR